MSGREDGTDMADPDAVASVRSMKQDGGESEGECLNDVTPRQSAAPGARSRSLRSPTLDAAQHSSSTVSNDALAAMRGYHIRITLSPHAGPSSATTSTSYKQASLSGSPSSAPQPFVPTSLFQPLPSHPPRFSTRRNTLSVHSSSLDRSPSEPARKDCRLGPLRIDWVDFSDMDVSGAAFIKVGSGKERERSSSQRKGASFAPSPLRNHTNAPCAPGEPATATFVPAHSKSGTTTLPEGVVHIFRDYLASADGSTKGQTYASAVSNPPAPQQQEPPPGESHHRVESDDVTLAVLAVPSWMTPSDFLAFVAPAADGMSHLRMIRSVSIGRSVSRSS